MMFLLKRLLIGFVCCFLWVAMTFAADGFVVDKIRVDGLQRVSRGTFLSYLPLKEGERFDPSQTDSVIHALYSTGFFSDITLSRRGNDLVVHVSERPVIGSIEISGNKTISKQKLLEALKNSGLAEGQVFNHSILAGVKQALVQQYYNLGRYNVQVDTTVTSEVRDRVAVAIQIQEG